VYLQSYTRGLAEGYWKISPLTLAENAGQ
jgi:hypothetical protein